MAHLLQTHDRWASEREEQLRFALEAGQMGTWDWDLATGTQLWSPELEQMFGLPVGAGRYRVEDFYALVHPDDLPGVKALAERAIAEGRDYIEAEFRVRRPDGEQRWISSRTRLYRGSWSDLVRMVGINADITERKRVEESLREREHFLQRLTEAVPNLIYVYDLEANRSSYANRELWELLGYTREERDALGEPFFLAVLHPDDRASVPDYLARLQALRDGSVLEREYRVRHRSGAWRWFFSRELVFARGPDGQPYQVLCAVLDITERVEADRALRESEARLAAFMEHSPGSMFIKDAAGRYVVVNHAFLTTSGKAAEEVIGKTDHEMFSAELADLFVAEDAEVRSSGVGQRFEETFLYNGRRFTFLSHKFPLPGGSVGCVGADITDQKLAEERLQELYAAALAINAANNREELLRLTAARARALLSAREAVVLLTTPGDAASQGLIVAATATQEGTAAVIGSGAARTFADRVIHERRTIQGDMAEPGLNPAERAAADQMVAGVQRGGRLLGTPLFQSDGAIFGALVLVGVPEWSVTPVAEASLAQLAQIATVAIEKRILYEQERAARAQAEEASRLKDEFLATVSHELRTPLTSFLGYAQLLQMRPRDEIYIARTVERMVSSARTQARLIDDLLDVSRIVSGKMRIEPRPIDFIAVIHAALDTVRPAIEAKGQHLHVWLQPEAGLIVGDAGRLQQVVWNLLSNATKFTPRGGAIRVLLDVQGVFVRFRVSDTGQGVRSDFLPYVFDRFRQADSTSRRVQGGLGLGLAIVHHLVELHGGRVEAASPGVGYGATFTVWLPQDRSAAPPATVAVVQQPDPCPLELRGLRVLLVDDQRDLLELMQEILASCGAIVTICDNAPEALEIVRSWLPDVLVSDVSMPGEDGYWLIKRVRELPREEGGAVPAIALTAYVRMEDRIRLLGAGYTLYVPKPVEPGVLRTVVASLATMDTRE